MPWLSGRVKCWLSEALNSLKVHQGELGAWWTLLSFGGNMGWCGVGVFIRELIEYLCEYTRALPV